MSSFRILTPVLAWIGLNAVTGLSLVIPLKYRSYSLPIILTLATISLKTTHYLGPGLSELWGLITLIGFMHFTSLLYVKKWSLRTDLIRLNCADLKLLCRQMYKVSSNPRLVHVSSETLLCSKKTSMKSTAPTGRFRMSRVGWLCVSIIMGSIFNCILMVLLRMSIDIHDFEHGKGSLRHLARLLKADATKPSDLRDIYVRVWFIVCFLWPPIMMLNCIHIILAIFFIYILRVDTGKEWPDLYGSSWEAYSLRRFWGRYVAGSRQAFCVTEADWYAA